MDLLDIFGDAGKDKPKIASGKVAESVADGLPDHLVTGAQAAAVAHDDAASASARYSEAEARLRKQMEGELADLKANRATAFEKLSEALFDLLSNMDKADVTKIPMADRPDIVVKISPGRRKSITKKWLVEAYGNEEAKKIWDSVPTGDAKREVIVPDRYEDEPDSY